jgi:hypothetical protein
LFASTILSAEDDLRKVRPSNFYPPSGSYPSASSDPHWTQNEYLFESNSDRKFQFTVSRFTGNSVTSTLELKQREPCSSWQEWLADLNSQNLTRFGWIQNKILPENFEKKREILSPQPALVTIRTAPPPSRGRSRELALRLGFAGVSRPIKLPTPVTDRAAAGCRGSTYGPICIRSEISHTIEFGRPPTPKKPLNAKKSFKFHSKLYRQGQNC